MKEVLETVAEKRELLQAAGMGTNLGPPAWAWSGYTPCPLLTPRTMWAVMPLALSRRGHGHSLDDRSN